MRQVSCREKILWFQRVCPLLSVRPWDAVRVGGTLGLFSRADFRQTSAQWFGKALFDFRRNQSHAVEVLNVDFIFQPEAGELHADKVGHGGDEDTLFRAYGSRSRNWFKVLRTDFFTYEN